MQFKFNPRNADDIFAEFFGFSTSFGGMGGSSCGPSFGGMMSVEMLNSFGDGRPMSSGLRKASPIENTLPCKLEELYKGTSKRMKISREICDASGKTVPVEEIITINVKPGWKKGTKITFPEKGNEHPGVVPADLVFIIDEKPHSLYTRDGNDLVVTKDISLAEALTGCTVQLTTLDERNLTITVNNVIHPDYEEVVPKEGMPLQKELSKRGNLRIKFNIKFPPRLTSDQKAGIQKLFSS